MCLSFLRLYYVLVGGEIIRGDLLMGKLLRDNYLMYKHAFAQVETFWNPALLK